MQRFVEILLQPRERHPKEWRSSFLALQLGFLAGGLGLLGRDLLIVLSTDNWLPIITSELFFAIFIAVGFFLHTFGFAALGVILACMAGVGSATAYIILSGWQTEFYLWYVNLAVLMLALPMRTDVKWTGAVAFIGVYCFTYLEFSSNSPAVELPMFTINVLGISNIVGSLLLLGLPMGLYSTALVKEKEKSERLLHNIMPKEIADKLQNTKKPIALENPEISVLMADIVNFTPLSEKKSAEQVVELLNGMFSRFDDLVEFHNVEKIKTIGDSYMVVAGVPQPMAKHASVLCQLAAELHETAGQFSDHEGKPIQLRIGINSGPAVSGVIGKSKFAFDVWGDTINTASRLESHGFPNKTHISNSTYKMASSNRPFKAKKQVVFLKGKGKVTTYLF